jgi:hypothetical protein
MFASFRTKLDSIERDVRSIEREVRAIDGRLCSVEHDVHTIDGRLCHLEGIARLALWGVPILFAVISAVATTVTVMLSHH